MGSRPEEMFLGNGERPRATGWGRAVPQFNNAFIIELRGVVAKFWEARADDVRRACAAGMPTGVIDEMDVLAFVTVDALGRPLLHADDANKFGKKVASKVSRLEDSLAKIDARTDAAVRRAREAAASDPSKLPRVAAAEESGRVERKALLDKLYDPQPPQSTIGAKRKERDGDLLQQPHCCERSPGWGIPFSSKKSLFGIDAEAPALSDENFSARQGLTITAERRARASQHLVSVCDLACAARLGR